MATYKERTFEDGAAELPAAGWDYGQRPICSACEKRKAEIEMIGYAERPAALCLCQSCALQLSRKLLEDLCALDGDRHG